MKLAIVTQNARAGSKQIPDEFLILDAARALGWDANAFPSPEIMDGCAPRWVPDVMLYTHAWTIPVQPRPNCRQVQWWFDLCWQDASLQVEQQARFRPDVMRSFDLVLMKERGLFDAYRDAGINVAYMDQGCWPPLAFGIAANNIEPEFNVGFAGGCYANGGRLDLIREVAKRWEVHVWSDHLKWSDEPVVQHDAQYNRALAQTVPRCRIWLGTNGRNDVDGYWSNRTWEILNAGGFLLSQAVPGFTATVTFDDPTHACCLIEKYLARSGQRRGVSHEGQVNAWQRHTYCDRLLQMVRILGGVE